LDASASSRAALLCPALSLEEREQGEENPPKPKKRFLPEVGKKMKKISRPELVNF
jgi:hypothetical protein